MPVKKTTTKMKQIMDDKLIESNCLRLPESAVRRRRRIHTSCLYKQLHKSSPKSANTLPFHFCTEQHPQDAEAPPPSSLDISHIHDHRPGSIRWHLHNGHPRHHQHQQYHQQLNTNGNSSTTTSAEAATQKYFSKKFSFTQHSNHLSRFYMIFIVFLIYLLDKINCDQGEYGIFAAIVEFNRCCINQLRIRHVNTLKCTHFGNNLSSEKWTHIHCSTEGSNN